MPVVFATTTSIAMPSPSRGCILCLGASLEGWGLSLIAASLFLSSLLIV